MPESFAELFQQNKSSNTCKPGQLIMAKVMDIGHDFILVDADLKSESAIPITQFKDGEEKLDIAVGDRVEVIIEALEDGHGQTRLSREKARQMRAWVNLEKAFAEGSVVTGYITGRVKGGLIISIDSIRAFLPGSLVDVRPVKDTSHLEGIPLELKVIKIDRARDNVIVSRREVVEKELSEERQNLINTLEKGTIIDGVVKNLTDYGAFISLGALDGLLHNTDMAWRKVKHPSEILAIGDEITVVVLDFDRDRNRVSLGLKQLSDNQWTDLTRNHPEGSRTFGKITNITDYGVFVDIEDGIEGLVHVSEMDWYNKNINPHKLCAIGDEVEVMVLNIDSERSRISLSIKQCKPNPWEAFSDKYSKGDKISGTIRSIAEFGIFVSFEDGIDGLVHLNEISWNEDPEDVIKEFKAGQEIETCLLNIDIARERISLGIKQLQENSFADYVSKHRKGDVVKGKLTAIEDNQLVIELKPDVEGIVRAISVPTEFSSELHKHYTVGQEIEAKITSIERKNRRLNLSIKAYEATMDGETVDKYKRKIPAGTLGDQLEVDTLKGELFDSTK